MVGAGVLVVRMLSLLPVMFCIILEKMRRVRLCRNGIIVFRQKLRRWRMSSMLMNICVLDWLMVKFTS